MNADVRKEAEQVLGELESDDCREWVDLAAVKKVCRAYLASLTAPGDEVRDIIREAVSLGESMWREALSEPMQSSETALQKVTNAFLARLSPHLSRGAADDGECRQAIATIRDAVLNGRHQLAEMEVDSDIINAVLGIIDDHTPVSGIPLSSPTPAE